MSTGRGEDDDGKATTVGEKDSNDETKQRRERDDSRSPRVCKQLEVRRKAKSTQEDKRVSQKEARFRVMTPYLSTCKPILPASRGEVKRESPREVEAKDGQWKLRRR